MQNAFEIIAEPNRRSILSLLAKTSEQSVGEIEKRLKMPQPTVSKHLRILRDAGFVEATVDAQRRVYRLSSSRARFRELEEFLEPFRKIWSDSFDALERHLDKKQKQPPKRGKSKQ